MCESKILLEYKTLLNKIFVCIITEENVLCFCYVIKTKHILHFLKYLCQKKKKKSQCGVELENSLDFFLTAWNVTQELGAPGKITLDCTNCLKRGNCGNIEHILKTVTH